MAEQKQNNGRELRGGLEGGEAARGLEKATADQGTPGVSNPSGGMLGATEVSRQGMWTDLAAHGETGPVRLAGGKTPEAILGYLNGVDFPAKKDWIVRVARRNDAPEDVIAALGMLPKTDYDDPDTLIRDYPLLPEADDVSSSKGRA